MEQYTFLIVGLDEILAYETERFSYKQAYNRAYHYAKTVGGKLKYLGLKVI